MNKYNKIPIDVKSSLIKSIKLIDIIENHLHIPKDSRLSEITIEFNISKERKITWKKTSGIGFYTKLFKLKEQELYEKYCRVSNNRLFEIK